MKTITKTILLLAVILTGVFVVSPETFNSFKQSIGSVTDAGTYSYKTITSTNASSTNPYIIRSGSGTLGSLVINTTHATVIRVYDGTATTTGTLIASLPASAVVGTYTYDVAVGNGVVIDVPAGFDGNYTVTFR